MRPSALAVLVSGWLAAGAASAQQPIEVTVRGSPASGFVATTSTDTAPREAIDAASLLDELPGVQIRRVGGEGSFASLSIRGSAPSQVGVFLGGIPLQSAADPAFDVGSLPLWPGASFRVYRGFAPASLGTTGYLGGVLAVDPPSPAVGARTEEWAAAGSFGALKVRLGDLRRVGDVEIGSGLFASRSDGGFPYVSERRLGACPCVDVPRTNAGVVSAGGIERVAVQRPWGSVAAIFFADARRTGVPGTDLQPTRFAELSTTRLVAGLESTVRTGDAGAVHVLGWARRETSDLADPAGELGTTHDSATKSVVLAAGVSGGWRGRPAAPLTVGAVVDGRVERFEPISVEGLQTSVAASRLAAGAGLDLEWRATPRLTVTASARADARHDSAAGPASPGAPSGAVSDVVPTGHAGASYRFADAAILSAHAGFLSRPPAFSELYGNGATLVASPGLGSERAFSADAGFSGDAGDGHVAAGYEIVGFFTAAHDLIVWEPLGLTTFRAENVDRALLGGGEIVAHLAARHLRTQVSYTLLFTEDLQSGRPLPDRHRHDLAYDASYQLGPVRVRYGVDLVAGVLVDGLVPLSPRIFHSAGLGLDVPGVRGLHAGLEVRNLFDQRVVYAPGASQHGPEIYPVTDFFGYPLPGRTLWATLRFTREGGR